MSQKANSLIERLKTELSIKKDKDLCQLLGIKHNTLSTWRKRDTLDFNKVLGLCEKHNLDLNYIFFEEEKQPDKALSNPMPQKTKTKRKNKLNLLCATSLVTTNRNIVVFYNQLLEGDKTEEGQLIVCQKFSVKKIVENTLYVIEDNEHKFYLDTFIIVNEKNSNKAFYLNGHEKKIDSNLIVNAWQVLEEPTDILKFIDGLVPIE